MQENQSDGTRFNQKISALRQKVLKLDGVETVDGISDDVCDKIADAPAINSKIAGKFFYTSQEQG